MALNLRAILLHNIILKVVAVMLGITFWIIISQSHITTKTVSVPLCFDGDTSSMTITAPENIQITVSGKRKHLHAIDMHALAVHVAVDALREGNNQLLVNNAQLFLPHTISVVHYSPLNATINVARTQPAAHTPTT